MLTIKKTPTYITRELCDSAQIAFDDEKVCYAALVERDICGFCVFIMREKTAIILYATAQSSDILDGVVRGAIAGSEELGATTYDFEVAEDVAKNILPLGFRKSVDGQAHSIEKLFTVCKGCGSKGE